MGKWKLAFISVLLQIFSQTFYWNISGVVFYQQYEFCPNCWFWLVAMATEKLNFREKKKNIQKSSSQKPYGGWSWNFVYISWQLLLHKLCFILLLPMCFRCYSNLKFRYAYNGKSGNWHLFLCYCRYFDKSFTEMFFGVVLYQPYEFCPNRWFLLVAMEPKG